MLSSSTLFHLVALVKWNLPAAPSVRQRDPTGHQTACHSHPIDRWAAHEHQRPATAVLADSPGDTVEEQGRSMDTATDTNRLAPSVALNLEKLIALYCTLAHLLKSTWKSWKMLDARKYWPQTWHQGIMVTLGSHAEYVNHCIELHLVPLLRKVPTCVDRDRASYHHITYLEMISNDIKRKLYIYSNI